MRILIALALLLGLAAPRARAEDRQYPQWTPAEEGWGAWTEIFFTDDQKVSHDVWCRWKDCYGPDHPASASLYVFESVSQIPFEMSEWQFAWPPRRTWTAYKTTFKTMLSHYSVSNGDITRDDGKFSMPLSQASTPGGVSATGSLVIVHPPDSMANDAPPAPKPQPKPAPQPQPEPKPQSKPAPQPDPPPQPKPQPSPSTAPDIDAALRSYSPIERAVIKKIASSDDLAKIASNSSDKDWHAAALDAARHDTDDPSKSPLRDYLKPLGFDDKAFAGYVGCDVLLGSPAGSGGASALDQLKAFKLQSGAGAAAPDPESIKSQADVVTAVGAVYPGLQKFCQDAANAGKVQEQQRPGGPQMSLSVLPPPAPGGGAVTPGSRSDAAPAAFPSKAPGDGAGSGGKKSWSDKMVDAALGGSIGWVAGALAATMLGLGPLGLLAFVIGGAGIGASTALKKT